MKTVIIGAGSLGRELQHWITQENWQTTVVFLDDTLPKHRGCKVLGTVDDADQFVEEDDVVLIALADPFGRELIARKLQCKAAPSTYRHGTTIAPRNGCLGGGSIMMPHSLASANTRTGRFALMNTSASLGHDVTIGDYVTLCSNVVLTGNVKVGNHVFIGTGAVVLPHVTIGDGAYIGAGSVVVRDVPAGAKMFGNPARVI